MSTLREFLANQAQVLIVDGAMGTMLQDQNPSLADFQGHEGCNEILNVSAPEMVKKVHRAYLEAGVDGIETNTFGANFGNLAEYGIEDRIYELAFAGAKLAREMADEFSSSGKRWVFGSIGPGTKLPTLGHSTYEKLRGAYQECARGLIDGGADALLIETSQDLLQTKAAINGSRAALSAAGEDLLIMAQVTVETTGTMLLGSEIGAALTALEPLGIDVIGLNCATGPAEMSEHLRQLSQSTRAMLSCMPNAGLPILENEGARYPLTPTELAKSLEVFVDDYGLSIIGGCCGTTPAHLAEVVKVFNERDRNIPKRKITLDPGAASLYQHTSFRQQNTYLAIGERTNANGSKAFRQALLAENWQECLEIAKEQIREGAHMLDLCVDYVGRDGVSDMKQLAQLFATSSTLPIVLDSTEPAVLQAGLEKIGGRAVINSVNYEDGDGAASRFAKIMPLVQEHGAAVVALTIDEEGQARTAQWKVKVAVRLIKDLTENWGLKTSDILIDSLTFPIATGQEETRRDAIETLEAIKEIRALYPEVQTVLGVSNVSFGLNPAARIILNSVFLHEAVAAGLTSAIIHPSKITPIARIDEKSRKLALDLIYDQRKYDENSGNLIYDPLTAFLENFEGVEVTSSRNSRAEQLAALSLPDRLKQRIIDGERSGLEDDLEHALFEGMNPLDIINNLLLDGMKTVGELFGKGEMQLPFVLQSAEVMKRAVAHLEPKMEKSDSSGRGKILLATVKGDVHDIGKNLVDIILSNNGYQVHNIGIKQTINTIIDEAEREKVDVIGMSGLLVKSTVIMKENLEELTARGLAERWPVILGGAALTRAFVEQDLADHFTGTVRYAKDAFEGLELMDRLMAIKRGEPDVRLPELRKRRTKIIKTVNSEMVDTQRSSVRADNSIPTPPFWGSRVVRGIPLNDYSTMLDERALYVGQWGLKGGKSFIETADQEGRPRLRQLLNDIQVNNWIEAAVVYGYFPCFSEGNDLVILDPQDLESRREISRFSFPRQRRDQRLCLSDFFAAKEREVVDVVAFHVVTMGQAVSSATAELFAQNKFREYLELHGLSVQLTEALAEYWHARIRQELGFGMEDSSQLDDILDQGYRGSRYSFGYPACPDLTQQSQLCELLKPERIGVSLSEEFQLHPEQSTSAVIVHHPEAKYFNAT
jgi:5-methyltetrahydrofolate--homocysteine methyltransferase